MGHWGYGTFENDNALDWVNDFETFLIKSIRSKWYDDNLAAIHTLVSISLSSRGIVKYSFPNFEIVDLAYTRLNTILKDDEWLSSWNSKELKKKEIKKLYNKLKVLRNRLVAKEMSK